MPLKGTNKYSFGFKAIHYTLITYNTLRMVSVTNFYVVY